MNLFLYSMYFYEISMIATQFLSACLPVLLTFALVCTRKPIVCRALIVLVAAKLSLYAISDHEMFQSKQKLYICTFEGTLTENSGVSQPCFMASVFFTYVCLSSLMSLSNFFSTNIILRLNFAFYTLLVGVGYLFALFLAQDHLMQSTQTVIIASIELGMGFSIVFLILMVGTGLWPIRLTTCFDSFPEEELLLSHLCIKWKVDTDLPKLEKMTLV